MTIERISTSAKDLLRCIASTIKVYHRDKKPSDWFNAKELLSDLPQEEIASLVNGGFIQMNKSWDAEDFHVYVRVTQSGWVFARIIAQNALMQTNNYEPNVNIWESWF